jgi:site-specific DNA-methyltransferase (adenine-specific)
MELNQVLLGDCLQIMQQISDNLVDFCLTDLPYGSIGCSWDQVIPFEDLWKQYNRVVKKDGVFALFSSQPFTTDLINSNRQNFKYEIIWNKNVPTGMSSAKYRPMKYHENILIFCRGKGVYNPIMKERVGVGKACYNYNHYCGESNHVKLNKVKRRYDPDWVNPSSVVNFKVVPNRNGKLHPTQKPIDLCEYLIKTYSNEHDIVLDSCVGSGSILVAAKNTNRNFIGIEKEEKYLNIAKKRLI